MSIKINYEDSFKIAEILYSCNKNELNFKNLNQKERKISLIALQNILHSSLPTNCISSHEFNNLIDLNKRVPTSYFGHSLISLFKGCLNFIGLRVSSKQLAKSYAQYTVERQYIISLLDRGIDEFINEEVEKINQMHEAIDWIKKFSMPLTQDVNEILTMISKKSFEESKHLLVKKIENLEKAYEINKEDEDFKKYLKLLKDINLIQNSKNYFKEIAINRRVNKTRITNYADVVSSHEKTIIPRIYKKITDAQLLNTLLQKKEL